MKRIVALAMVPCALVAGTTAYIATALNTPCTGFDGQIVSVQFASTNQTGTATVSSITDLSVGGRTVSFTNELATATLSGGTATVAPTNAFVAPGQRVIVGGTAFPGGSATMWITR